MNSLICYENKATLLLHYILQHLSYLINIHTKHLADVLRGEFFLISFCTLLTNEVSNALLQLLLIVLNCCTINNGHLITIGFLLLESDGLIELIGCNAFGVGREMQLYGGIRLCCRGLSIL